MMDKCLECGGELEHIEGRKKKKFCDENCKGAYWYKNNNNKEPKYVQFKTFKDLKDKFDEMVKLSTSTQNESADVEKKEEIPTSGKLSMKDRIALEMQQFLQSKNK